MKTAPIVASTLAFTETGVPFSTAFGDIYHPQAGALPQARHVFLSGNELPARWQRRERFVVLETGFGLGNNFLSTWQAWRDDPARCERLVFISIEKHPLTAPEMRQAHRESPIAALANELLAAWPPLVHTLHTLDFDGGRVRLMLAFGDVHDWLPEIVASVDAFYLDGFAPAKNERMWDAPLLKALGRLAAPGATLATWTAASAVRDRLRSAGFDVRKAPGTGGKRDITLARYAPAFTPRHAPSRLKASAATNRHAVVVGSGLAGCATAAALAEQGWSVTLLERHAQPASEASGNPAGLFHGIVNAQDGTHARFNRSAALMAQSSIARALAADATLGSASGLLRLDDSPVEALRTIIESQALPADYVQAVSAQEASALSGLPMNHPAWYYPGGGWVRPAALCRWWLHGAGGRVCFVGGVSVDRLENTTGAWRLVDAAGHVIEEAAAVVLCNAGDAMRLLPGQGWPIEQVRGQISQWALEVGNSLTLPRLPVAGSGYLLPPVDGTAVFGSTAQPADLDATVRSADHNANLRQLERLLARPLDLPVQRLSGRTAWRWIARDRLPLIGAVPHHDSDAIARPIDQPRFVPRSPGLYVFTALASRGITWSVLGARALASGITGAPAPMEASLLDSVDPARFMTRAVRKNSGPG